MIEVETQLLAQLYRLDAQRRGGFHSCNLVGAAAGVPSAELEQSARALAKEGLLEIHAGVRSSDGSLEVRITDDGRKKVEGLRPRTHAFGATRPSSEQRIAYATAAMQGLLGTREFGAWATRPNQRSLARRAFEIADAMITAERQ
ncbi:MAG: hypothetical protein KC543_17095 [Myxococcales bacterium]|nr:hypothetical protein [Myxococcales bacterium]